MRSTLLLVTFTLAAARVRLNSLHKASPRPHALLLHPNTAGHVNRDDVTQLHQCISDLDCAEGSFCHAPFKHRAASHCRRCGRRKRRCHRDSMCCLGSRCSDNVCTPDLDTFLSQSIPDTDGGMNLASKRTGWRKRDRAASIKPPVKAQIGDPCLRSSDCSEGLCCARHFWARICKPLLQEGQVCTRHRRKDFHGLELFQRCHCGAGFSCRMLRGPASPSSPPCPSSASSLLAATQPKLPAGPSSAHTRLPSPSLSPSSAASACSPSASRSLPQPAATTRLHVCQRP